MSYSILKNGAKLDLQAELVEKEKYAANRVNVSVSEGEAITIYKYVANVTSRNHGFGEWWIRTCCAGAGGRNRI